jgi:hypothetical protein
MSYIGSNPVTQSFIAGTDYFNGNGSTTAFTLSRSVVSVNDIQATVNNVVQQPNDAYTVSGNTITFTSAPSAGTNNVYVRYISTTTQSITPSQNTVSYSTLNSDNQSKLGISFKNRIINGAMVIDQRNAGASVTPSNAQYTLDRWVAGLSQASKFSVQQNAGSVTAPVGFTNYLGVTSLSSYSVSSSDFFIISQFIEGYNCADLAWGTANAKTVTLSFWVRSSLTGTFGGSLHNSAWNRSYPFSYSISSANTWTQISITVAGDITGTWDTTNGTGIAVVFGLGNGSTYSGTAGAWAGATYGNATGATSVVGTNGATWYVTGVQLEVGTQATTFDYRSYGTELALCQRYYQTINGGISVAYDSSSVSISVPYKVTMRAAPTASLPSGTIVIDRAGSGGFTSSGASIGGSNIQTNAASLNMTGWSGLSVGWAPLVWQSAAWVNFSAEL